MTIKTEVLEQLKKNVRLKAKLAYEFEKHGATINRWIENNDPMLTTVAALRIIKEETGLKKSDILDK